MNQNPTVLIEIPKPDDFHIHLRQGAPLRRYTADVAATFRRALVMPNTLPPVKTEEQVRAYRDEIRGAAADAGFPEFEPLATFKIGTDVAPEAVAGLSAAGAVAGKLYPQGSTTNSQDGVTDLRALYSLFEAMQAEGLVLSIHGEDPSVFSLDREAAFLPAVASIVRDFPGLRIVMEHISTEEALRALRSFPDRVAATVTVHHLAYSLDDLIGDRLDPHLFCKPVLKSPEHARSLRDAVFGGQERLFFGSDSAPHPVADKESSRASAGIYTAPTALPVLADLFDAAGVLDAFEAFVCSRGAEFYGLAPSGTLPDHPRIRIVEEPWTVPALCGPAVPFRAGARMRLAVRGTDGRPLAPCTDPSGAPDPVKTERNSERNLGQGAEYRTEPHAFRKEDRA